MFFAWWAFAFDNIFPQYCTSVIKPQKKIDFSNKLISINLNGSDYGLAV